MGGREGWKVEGGKERQRENEREDEGWKEGRKGGGRGEEGLYTYSLQVRLQTILQRHAAKGKSALGLCCQLSNNS